MILSSEMCSNLQICNTTVFHCKFKSDLLFLVYLVKHFHSRKHFSFQSIYIARTYLCVYLFIHHLLLYPT